VGGEVVIGGQDAGADQFLLEGGDKIEEVLRGAAADIVDGIGRQGQAVLPGGLFRRTLHDAKDAFHDVVHVGKVPLTVAVVEDLNRLARGQLLRGGEIEHIRPPRGTVDREEAEPRGGDVVELRIAVGQQFVALFCCRIQGYRVIYLVLGAERHLLIAAVDRGTGGID